MSRGESRATADPGDDRSTRGGDATDGTRPDAGNAASVDADDDGGGGGRLATDGGSAGTMPSADDDEGTVLTAPTPAVLVEAVCRAVATEAGVDPATLQPLYDSVDPDALGRLFAHGPSAGRGSTTVSFRHAGCVVRVDRAGRDVTVAADAVADAR